VLPVTSPALARPGIRARGRDAVGRGGEHLDRIGPKEIAVVLGHPGADPLTGQCVPDEDHSAVQASHATAAVCDSTHLELDDPLRLSHISHPTAACGPTVV
jgi:hypothetical protein